MACIHDTKTIGFCLFKTILRAKINNVNFKHRIKNISQQEQRNNASTRLSTAKQPQQQRLKMTIISAQPQQKQENRLLYGLTRLGLPG